MRKVCKDCGAHAFDRRCRVCGSEQLEDLGPRFASAAASKEAEVAVGGRDEDHPADTPAPEQ